MKAFIIWLFHFKPAGESQDLGLLTLRLLFTLPLSIRHGWPTLIDWWNGDMQYPDPLGLGESLTMLIMGCIEAICTVLVAVGLYTRISAFLVASGFLVAVVVVHGADPFGVKELAYMYMSGFLSVFLLGPGRFSLDNYLHKE